MNIQEDYVSFETAKLLKEKGFDVPCFAYYYVMSHKTVIAYDKDFPKNSDLCLIYTNMEFGSMPTLQMAMKWLREVHNINISVVPHSHKEGKPFDYEFVYWNGVKYHIPYNEKHPTYHELFGRTWKKHEQACETAIKYCLENLI